MFDLALNFWLENIRFVIYVLAALGFFSAGWLNLDSHRTSPESKILVRAIGFFVIALWFLFSASGYSFGVNNWVAACVELIGVIILTISFYLEPVPDDLDSTDHPKSKNFINHSKKMPSFIAFSMPKFMTYIVKLPVFVWALLLYRVWVFSMRGLMKDFAGLRNALVFILLSRLLSLADLFSTSTNIIVFNLTRKYSYLWICENVLLLFAVIILLKWTFFYLRFRPVPKLFITFLTTSILVFVISTVTFTSLSYSANQKNILGIMTKNAAIFDFSIKELKKQNALSAYSLSQREQIISGLSDNNTSSVVSGLGDPIKDLQVGGAAITNRSGEVLAASGSYILTGSSLVNDPPTASALKGETVSSLMVARLLDTNQIVARSTFPVVKDEKVIGVAVTDFPIDQAFVDNVKELTKQDITINIGEIRNVTSFVDYNQRRISGTKITNNNVSTQINKNQNSPWAWSGAERIGSLTYLTVYRSLSDSDNLNIASIMVGEPLKGVVDDIMSSIKLTFLSVSVLMLISLFPLYLIARSVSGSRKTQE